MVHFSRRPGPARPGLAWPLAVAALGTLLARHGRVPAPAGYALALAAVLFPPSRIADVAPLAVAVDLVTVAALATIGLALIRDTDARPTTAFDATDLAEDPPGDGAGGPRTTAAPVSRTVTRAR